MAIYGWIWSRHKGGAGAENKLSAPQHGFHSRPGAEAMSRAGTAKMG